MGVCGVDEAGRGPVIGPLVMAGVLVNGEEKKKLEELGIKDSKQHTPKQREFLALEIRKIVGNFSIQILSAQEVDDREKRDLGLNELEAEVTARILKELRPDKAILDCPSTNPNAYKKTVKELIDFDVDILAEHKADENHIEAAAASILAKVTRDTEIEILKKKIGIDFGSGYPSDPKTKAFLKDHWTTHPEVFRKTWASFKAQAQKTLEGF